MLVSFGHSVLQPGAIVFVLARLLVFGLVWVLETAHRQFASMQLRLDKVNSYCYPSHAMAQPHKVANQNQTTKLCGFIFKVGFVPFCSDRVHSACFSGVATIKKNLWLQLRDPVGLPVALFTFMLHALHSVCILVSENSSRIKPSCNKQRMSTLETILRWPFSDKCFC